MDNHEWPRCVKSVRRKKRLVKTDRDKQLIQLYKRRRELWDQWGLLPLVQLEHPYQSGWKRFFVVRDDVKRSEQFEFYQTLLGKINTTEYHHDKSFKRKKRRKSRYVYTVKEQKLKEFDQFNWYRNKMELTDKEKACFTRVERYNVKTRQLHVSYVFTERWRYVLKVVPNIITHKRLLDTILEAEIAAIDNYINSFNLKPRIELLTRGRGFNNNDWYCEPLKYINNLKNLK